MTLVAGIRPSLRRLARAFVGPEVPDELVTEVPRGALRLFCAIVAVVGLAFAATMAAQTPSRDPGLGFLLALGAAVVLCDWIGMPQRRASNVLTVFSDSILLVSLLVMGFSWGLIAVVVGSELIRYLRALRLTGGWFGAWFNIGLHLTECSASVLLVGWLAPDAPLYVQALVAALATYIVTTLAMTIAGLLHGDGFATGRSAIISSGSHLSSGIPFLILGLYTMAQAEYAALLGMMGPTILSVLSTRAEEQLVVVEEQLGKDGLTGVATRRRLQSELSAHTRRSQRVGATLTALMLDVDNFKVLNDTYGHAAGDEALVRTAATLTACVRQCDMVARYGGEEFTVLVSDVNLESVMSLAERIRAACEMTLATWGATVSIGVIHLEGSDMDELDATTILRLADSAMYRAKFGGKNQVVLADESDHLHVSENPIDEAELLVEPDQSAA